MCVGRHDHTDKTPLNWVRFSARRLKPDVEGKGTAEGKVTAVGRLVEGWVAVTCKA